MSVGKHTHILYIPVNTMYKGMAQVVVCMTGLNHTCKWEVGLYIVKFL